MSGGRREARTTANGGVEHYEDRYSGVQRNRPKRNLGFRAWIKRMLFLFDVTMVPYMLDWWERLLVRLVVLIAMWYVCYKSTQVAMWCFEEFSRRLESSS
ncbi:uncharacterized protein LOC112349896 isoform X1 [Selaginella moellendorffii]|uniref:uncharacterized protein LOC112349896 isoform X1 n=1 Tax=Selaginella moellendorffii TaxID=88036 RepID=UPI000D1CED45|nr:uncharacterized protein LOC112349896 isoform X1 [Selaginella moellendorffii]|eukprot:XP_024540885.1 uncharacterized protein LOC112349896 isoform X1 [Selaginella moellendorffii]